MWFQIGYQTGGGEGQRQQQAIGVSGDFLTHTYELCLWASDLLNFSESVCSSVEPG